MFVSRFRCARAVAAAAAAAAAASGADESGQETVWCDTWQEEQGAAYEETSGDDEREQAGEEAAHEHNNLLQIRDDLHELHGSLSAMQTFCDSEEQEGLPSSSSALLSGWSHAQQHSPPTARQRPQLAGKTYQRRQLSPEPELESPKESQLHDEQSSCRRCTSRHKLAAARIGPPVTPHRPLDLNRPVPQPVPSTPSTPSRPPRFSSPSPRSRAQLGRDASQEGGQQLEACSRSQSVSKIASTRSTSLCRGQASARERSKSPPRGLPATCECMAETLAEFSERLHGFLLAFMGFHHPHKDRLRAAVDQQVGALGSGLTSMLTAQKVFHGLRSRARESALLNKLQEYRQKLLEARQQLQEAQEVARKEAALRRHAQNVSLAAKERSADAQAAAARLLCHRPCGSEMQLQSCLAAWQRCAAAKSSARKSATRSVFTALASEETSVLRLVLAKWQQVAMASRQKFEVAAASDAVSKAVFHQIDNAKAATVAAVIASSHRCDHSRSARCFMAWNRAALISRCQELHTSVQASKQRVAEQANSLLQFRGYLGRRPRSEAAPGAFCLKAILMSWAREADNTARRRHILEATHKVATRASELLYDRVTSNLLRGCFSGWARSGRMTADWNARTAAFTSDQQAVVLQTENQQMQCTNLLERAPATESKTPKTSAPLRLHEQRSTVPCGTTLRTFVQEEGHQTHLKHQLVFADCTNEPAMHRSAQPRIEKDRLPLRQDAYIGVSSVHELEEGLRPSDAKDHFPLGNHETMPSLWQDAHIDVSSLHEHGGWLRPSDAVKHYCLASQASQSEDGYLELLAYHRQRARDARARQGRDGARNFGQARQ